MPGAVTAERFVVAAGHDEAARAALAAFDAGGSVADAAIAASAALCVLLPQATSIGGDLLALYRDGATGRIHGLDAAGVAPAAAGPTAYSSGVPRKGIRAAVVPGIVRGWEALHQRHGRLPWRRLFDHAIAFAAEGYPLAHTVSEFIDECRAELVADAGCAQLFSGCAPGSILRQEALAATLAAIAEGGAAAFYAGVIAQRLASFFRERDGLLALDDLRGYAPRWTSTLSTGYRGLRIEVMPPSSFGLLLLLQLHAFESLHPAGMPDDARTRFDVQLNAMRAAFALGEPLIADVEALRRQAARPALRDAVAAMVRQADAPLPADLHSGTACVVAGDAAGNIAVLVQSVYQPFGAACADPATGVLLNNRMFCFSNDARSANGVAPGKRPAHTLCPVIVSDGAGPRWAFASPGGVSQTVTGAQILCNLMDRGMSLAQAVDAPRWCLSRSREVLVEPGFDGASAGAAVRVQDDPYSFGSVKLIGYAADGRLSGYADKRRSACALGH